MDNNRVSKKCQRPQIYKADRKHTTATMTVKANGQKHKINIEQGFEQGDVISPKLFSLLLEDI